MPEKEVKAEKEPNAFQEFLIGQAIQSVMGLVAVAMSNPNSKTFSKFHGPLKKLRDLLNGLSL
jgi:hypothetical protein